MSGRLVGEVLRYAPESLRAAEFLVLIVLAENAHDHDRVARLGAAEIAHRARLSPGGTRNALSSLAARALIQPMISKLARGRSQDYKLHPLSEYHRRPIASPHDDT
jgi:hypothetical protein